MEKNEDEKNDDEEKTCQVCFERSKEILTRICNGNCKTKICLDCMMEYLNVTIQSQITTSNGCRIPVVRCPLCLIHMRKEKWLKYASSDAIALFDEATRTATSLSCTSCGSCYQPHFSNISLKATVKAAGGDLDKIFAPYYPGTSRAWKTAVRTIFTRNVNRFYNIKDSVTTFYSYIAETFEDKTEDVVWTLLALMKDEERQCVLFQHYMKNGGNSRLYCCAGEVSFTKVTFSPLFLKKLIKAAAYAEAESRKLQHWNDWDIIEVGRCPACCSIFIKGEGCPNMICSCGESFYLPDHVLRGVHVTRKNSNRGVKVIVDTHVLI